jgi:hypothetical protein
MFEYVFSLDIPFEGRQSLSNMRWGPKSRRCHWRLCHSGVNDTAMPCAAESDFRTKTVWQIIGKDIRQTWLHSGVMTVLCITAVSLIPQWHHTTLTPLWYALWWHWHQLSWIRSYIICEKALTRISGVQGQLFNEKTRGRKSRVRVSLRQDQNFSNVSYVI